jgi:hypothetical protein
VCVVVRAVRALRCMGCGSDVGADARFCPNCGAPFGETVPPSCIIYLFGDRFVAQDRLLGEKLPCGEVKVGKKALAQEMMRAAFASLAGGVLSLKFGQRKRLLFKTGAVFAALNSQEKCGGLEGRIVEAFTGDPSRDCVEEIVARAVGEECADPWGAVVDAVREHLLGLGYFTEEGRSGLGRLVPGRKLLPNCQRINTLQGQVPAVQTLLREFSSRDAALDKQLGEDIKKGITSRYAIREVEADE